MLSMFVRIKKIKKNILSNFLVINKKIFEYFHKHDLFV